MKSLTLNKTWLLALTLIISLSLILSGCGGDKAVTTKSDGPIIAKFTHVVAAETPKGKAIQYFATELEKRSNGRIKVEVYPSSQLYGDADEMEALVANNCQFIAPSSTKVVSLDPGFQIFDLMFLFPTEESVIKFFNDPEGGQKMLSRLEKKGLVGIGFIPSGFKQWFNSKKPIVTPADMSGVKWRAAAGGILTEQYTNMGSTSVSIPFGEVYSALQLKTVDGSENSWANIYSQKFFEVCQYITVSDHGRFDYSVISNKKFMDSLPEDLRALVKSTWRDSQDYAARIVKEEEENFKKQVLSSDKVKVVTLTPEQREAFKKSIEPTWNNWKSKIGEDIFERALAASEAK
ncbi:DctP family TRAP transporter solute-binding subunit [Selenomonadales bacterium OttesenSCG-928-I06]|nr:DctP family TRAP transporter solute-binding subunit [Selenomonadales bacterium OttesenSCG-928-I06]